jgi:hypothetical protein
MLAISTTQNIRGEISQQGYSVVPGSHIPMTDELARAWEELRAEYPHLPADEFLPGGARYRFRRYDRFYFLPSTGELHLLPHKKYFQSEDINTVTGGIVRDFAPLTPETVQNPFLHELIAFDFEQFPLEDEAMRENPWQVDVHQIFVKSEPGETGQPTPEGVHRDGAEFVTVHLTALHNAEGGVVSVYDDDKSLLESFRLNRILDSYLFNDAILWHGVTPIQSADGVHPAERGILTFDYHYMPDLTPPR